MRKSVFNENYKDGKLHDQKGELHVKYLEEPNKLNYVFVEAAQSLQKKKIPDFNAGDNEGLRHLPGDDLERPAHHGGDRFPASDREQAESEDHHRGAGLPGS